MGHYSNRYWCCPYWHRDKPLAVYCECGKIQFPDKKARNEYIQAYCTNVTGWKRCQMAQMMETYYERTENEENECSGDQGTTTGY